MTEIQEIRSVALEAARAAGVLSLQRFREPMMDESVRTKTSPTDLVSEADERAEHAIVSRITARRPRDTIVAEESANIRGSSEYTWYVDPLDGTINFLYGIPHWCVAICCADADGALFAVVYDAIRDEEFVAERGRGADLFAQGPRDDYPIRLAVSAKPDLASALIGTGFAYVAENRRAQGRILANVVGEVRDIRRAGSASLDLAYVAAARFDGYFESVDKPWDWMAGALLVREAGGRVTELTPSDPALPRIIASGPRMHDKLVALVARASAEL